MAFKIHNFTARNPMTIRELKGIAPWQRRLEGVGQVKHPQAMPRHWRQGRHLVPSAIKYAMRYGWKLVRTEPHVLSPQPATLLLPSEPLLAGLASPQLYGALLTAGIVKHPQDVHLPPAFNLSHLFGSPLHHLKMICESTCLAEAPEGYCFPRELGAHDPSEVIAAGGVLVNIAGRQYLYDHLGLTFAELRMPDLQHFAQIGLLNLRTASQDAKERVPRGELIRYARDNAILDLELFAVENIERWGTQPLQPVIYLHSLSSRPLSSYPELVSWLRKALPLLEPEDVNYAKTLLDHLESAATLSQQEGIAHSLAGLLGEIALRPSLLRNYQNYQPSHSNAILLLAHHIASADGLRASDGILGNLTSGETGDPLLELGMIYEMTITALQNGRMRFQLSRALDDRFADGLHIRGTNAGITVPVTLPHEPNESTHAWVLDESRADEIRDVIHSTLTRALTRTKASLWKIPHTKKGATATPALEERHTDSNDDTIVDTTSSDNKQHLIIRPTSPFHELTVDQLNQWADEVRSDRISLQGRVDRSQVYDYSIHPITVQDVRKGGFVVTLEQYNGIWRATSALGQHVTRVISILRNVNGLIMPSNEWLDHQRRLHAQTQGARHPKRLTAFSELKSLVSLTTPLLDQWANEWGSNKLIIKGYPHTNGSLYGFDVSATPPTSMTNIFTITLHKDRRDWRVVDIKGRQKADVASVLRKVETLSVSSNEWFDSLLDASTKRTRFRMTTFSHLDDVRRIDANTLNQWSADWSSNTIALLGRANSADGIITAFKVRDAWPDTLKPSYFALAFELHHGRWALSSAFGHSLERIISILRQCDDLTIPSNERIAHFLLQAKKSQKKRRRTPPWLRTFTSIESFRTLSASLLDQWAGPVEWNSDHLVLYGRPISRDHKYPPIQGFGIATEIPKDLSRAHFTITLQRHADGWHVREVGGITVSSLIPTLRSNAELSVASSLTSSVASDQWLLRRRSRNIDTRTNSLNEISALTANDLNQWASPDEWNSDDLFLDGIVKTDGSIHAFRVASAQPQTQKHRFTISLQRHQSNWHALSAHGSRALSIVKALRKVEGLQVPSDEWLTRHDKSRTETRFNSIDSLKLLSADQLNKWASTHEWNSDRLVLIGRVYSNHQISKLTIRNELPEKKMTEKMVLSFERQGNQWALATAYGQKTKEILKALRAGSANKSGILILSDEWLSRMSHKTSSQFTSVAALEMLTPDHLTQWGHHREWNSDTLHIHGYIESGRLIGFKVNGGSTRPSKIQHFTITFTSSADGDWMVADHNNNLNAQRALAALATAGFKKD